MPFGYRDKGVSGPGAEDAGRLLNASFLDEHRSRFVQCSEGKSFGILYCNTTQGLLNSLLESGDDDDGVASLAYASGSDRPHKNDRSYMPTTAKQPKLRVTTIGELLNPLPESTDNDGATSLAPNASGSDRPHESDRSYMTAGGRLRFRVTTAEAYVERPHKRRCI